VLVLRGYYNGESQTMKLLFGSGLVFSLLCGQAQAQEEGMRGLSHLTIDTVLHASINYNARSCRLLMRRFTNDADIPFTDILLTRLVPALSDTFLIQYNPGPSDDPEFSIYRRKRDSLVELGSIGGLELSIPGTGFIFVSGHNDNMFNKRRQFSVTRAGLKEIQQPFYYVGLRSIAKNDIPIYGDTALAMKVLVLHKGSNVEVLLNRGDLYLLKTPYGIVGWTRIPDNGSGDTPIEGLFYAGD